MLYYLTAAGLVALTFFWGAGLSWLIMPRRWIRCWPLLALPAGLALQSAVVWIAGWLPLAGTDAYARAALVLPAALLALAWFRRPGTARAPLAASSGALALALLVALLAVGPWARHGGALTAIANGSCDVADYAAGGRVLREFRPDDRAGFVGQRAVAGILHVDNFYAHWRELNHFTPAALLALNATLAGRQVHEIASVFATVLLAAVVSATVLLARGVVRLPPRAALAVAALVGLGAVQGYAVYQVALGQLLAAAAVGWLTWAGFELLRAAAHPRRAWAFLPTFALAWWLLLGSYAFFAVVCLAPLAGALGWCLFRQREGRRFGRAMVVAGAAVALASAFGWDRVAGFALRWKLHDTVEYGWPIPRLLPDGWLGLVASAELARVAGWWGWPVAAALLFAFFRPWKRFVARDPLRAWTVAGLVGPAVAGYAILSVKGAVPGSNASYDAYKLLACFQPVLLAGLLWWWRNLRGRLAVALPLALVLAAWCAAGPLRRRAEERPLAVYPELSALQSLEREPAVHSVNILCDTMWDRLWANAFLLRKEQFFSVPTYEGRSPTRLEGEWDVRDAFLRVRPAAPADSLLFNRAVTVSRARPAGAVSVQFASGWHDEERAGPLRWRWTDGAGRITVTNRTARPVHAVLALELRSSRPTTLRVLAGGQELARTPVGVAFTPVVLDDLPLPPGTVEVTLASDAVPPGGGDDRLLGVAIAEFALQAK